MPPHSRAWMKQNEFLCHSLMEQDTTEHIRVPFCLEQDATEQMRVILCLEQDTAEQLCVSFCLEQDTTESTLKTCL